MCRCRVFECIAVWCSVLRCVAVCYCSVLLQCFAARAPAAAARGRAAAGCAGVVCLSVLQCGAVCCGVLLCIIPVFCCNVLLRAPLRLCGAGRMCRSCVLQCVAAWCAVLQYVAVCRSTLLQCVVAAWCCCDYAGQDSCRMCRSRVLQCDVVSCVAVCCSVLQRVLGIQKSFGRRMHRYLSCLGMGLVLQYVAVCCSVLQCVTVCCSVLQCVAVC